MFPLAPSHYKQLLQEAGLASAFLWWNNLEFQHHALWPQRHLNADSETEIHQKVLEAHECVNQAASELMAAMSRHVMPNMAEDTARAAIHQGCLVFAESLIKFSDPLAAAEDYFRPVNAETLLASHHRSVENRLIDNGSQLPQTGNLPAVRLVLELSNIHLMLVESWQTVFGVKYSHSIAFKARLDELGKNISELKALCCDTPEARMSNFAMKLVQLSLTLMDDLDITWLDLPEACFEEAKPRLQKLLQTEWPQLLNEVSAGMPEFLHYLRCIPAGLKSRHIQAAIAAGKLVIDVPGNRVFFKGDELTRFFAKQQQAFETLVDYSRAAKRHRLVTLEDFPAISWETFRGRHARLLKVHQLLKPHLRKGNRKQTYQLILEPSEIVLIEHTPGLNVG